MRNNPLIKFTLSNLGWMLASLFLALSIWVAANMADNPVVQDEISGVSVRILLPEGYVITARPEATTVTAIVRAPRRDWDLLLPGDLLVTANLQNLRAPGEYRVKLEADVAEPLHGRVVALRPSTWTISIDTKVEARLAVEVLVTETPPLGYTYGRDITCDATEVVVSGSSQRVRAVDRVEARLDLSEALNPVRRTVNLIPVQADGSRAREIELVPATVVCDVDVRIREGVTPVEVLPDRGGTAPPRGYTFQGYTDISPQRVGVTGDAEAIDAMNSVIRTMPIDLSDKTQTFTTEVALALPAGVELVEGSQLVRVTVLITPVIDSREFVGVPVAVVGLDTALYDVEGLADTVTVNVSGPMAQLETLNLGNIRIVADLTGLLPGNHQVTPQASLIGVTGGEELTISSILPGQFSVTILPQPTPTPAGAAPPP